MRWLYSKVGSVEERGGSAMWLKVVRLYTLARVDFADSTFAVIAIDVRREISSRAE